MKATRVFSILTGRIEDGEELLLYVRDSLEDKSFLVTHFYLVKPDLYLQ